MNVTKSSLLPTAIVLPSGDHVILIFSPLVLIVVAFLPARISQMRTVLSPLAVLSRLGSVACQHNWSTDPVCPRNVVSFAYGIRGKIFVKVLVDSLNGWNNYQTISIQCENCNRFIEWTWSQTSAITIPADRMDLQWNYTESFSGNVNVAHNLCRVKTASPRSRIDVKMLGTYLWCVCFLLFRFIVSFEIFLQFFHAFWL